MEPDVWRKDVRRAKERIGTRPDPDRERDGHAAAGGDVEALIADYALCAGGRPRRAPTRSRSTSRGPIRSPSSRR